MQIILNVVNVFTNLTLQEAFETAAEINRELKTRDFEGAAKNSNFY